MKRACASVAMFLVLGTPLALIRPAAADPVCDAATPLPVVGGLLSGGLQTGLLNVGPLCPSASPAPTAATTGGGTTPSQQSDSKTVNVPSPSAASSSLGVTTTQTGGATATRSSATTPAANKSTGKPKSSLVRFAEVFSWIDTPFRVAFALFCVVALIIAMWMGARVGRRRARALSDVAADAQLSAVMSVVPDAILVTDEKNAVRAMNAAAAEMLGVSDDVRGTSVARVIRGADRSGITLESWMRASDDYPSGTTGTLESGLPIGIAATPVRAEKTIVGHVYLVRDLRKERALERMKEEFLSNVSHELRTPLASALGFARLLQRRELSATQQGAFVGAIVEACERLDRVIDLLIDVAALEGGSVVTDTQPLDVAGLVNDAAARWSERSPEHVIAARVGDGVPAIGAAVALVRSAVDELIDNAIKFSPDGGIVTVAADLLPGGKPSIAISVADQGIGIDAEKKAVVFDDFHQVDGSATRRFGGLGIGLAFVRRVAEAHGGRVEIASEEGRGSTFSLVLPARAPRPKSSTRTPAKSRKEIKSSRRSERVLQLGDKADR